MLIQNDYCDYDTCVALKELGCALSSFDKWENKEGELELIPHYLLYFAQKWLREEKKIIIEATFNLMYKGQPRFSWRILYNLTQHKGAYYTFDSVKSKGDYDSYEEALSEGVREAIKILKEE